MTTHTDMGIPCTQAEFGEMVGVSQQTVSELAVRGVIAPGGTAGQWLLAYTTHLREQATARGADSELAFQRSELARVGRERAEIRLAQERSEYAPVALIEQILAHVGRSIAGVLEPVPNDIARQCPRIGTAELQLLQQWVDQAREIALRVSLDSLTETDDVAEGDSDPDVDALADEGTEP